MKAPSGPCTPNWAPARKDIVGASLGSSRLWFTVAQGIVTEVYYPRIDIPQIKDLGFIIADDKGFWVELRRLNAYSVALPKPGVPAAEIIHRHPRFTFTLEVCASQSRDTLLMRYTLEGDANLKPYALLAARLGDDARSNVASAATHDGRRILWAEQGPFAIALSAIDENGADGFGRRSVGCLEVSDGWQDFNKNGRMTWEYDSAGPGCVTLMGEITRRGTLALGLAGTKEAAATLSVSVLLDDFDEEWANYCRDWEEWLGTCRRATFGGKIDERLALSAAVLKVHQDRTYRGATVASLSVPWGDTSMSRGGYHLVWPRDLVETAGALVAVECYRDARDVLRYLIATQQEDGHWFQNQWLGGRAFWQGVQLDEAAFPILLVSLLHERDALDGIPVKDMVARAVGFVCREGPSTNQDRWEENAGINIFTLAVAIPALVEGSTFLDGPAKQHALMVADYWNARLEPWAFAQGTSPAKRVGVNGHFVRTVPLDACAHRRPLTEIMIIKNLANDPRLPASDQVSTDCLQLVRYGLRSATNPCITDSLKVIDHLLKTDTPSGPVWHRYNDDGYGEHDGGGGFDGTGRGRGWPLLTGERGHYALCAGEDITPYLEAMMAMSSPLGLIPEQVWDSAPIPAHRLEPGKPSDSAMPLVWAHAEFIKLCHSLAMGRPADRPAATWARYRGVRPEIDYEIWGPSYQPRHIAAGLKLYVALRAPATIHFGTGGWKNIHDIDTTDTGLGVHVAKLPTEQLKAGGSIQFTFQWRDTGNWEGKDYEVAISAPLT